jgi:hypothetical protein
MAEVSGRAFSCVAERFFGELAPAKLLLAFRKPEDFASGGLAFPFLVAPDLDIQLSGIYHTFLTIVSSGSGKFFS